LAKGAGTGGRRAGARRDAAARGRGNELGAAGWGRAMGVLEGCTGLSRLNDLADFKRLLGAEGGQTAIDVRCYEVRG
jgi:hypothetical protein